MAVMSAAVPAEKRPQAQNDRIRQLVVETEVGVHLRRTVSPRILLSCVPVLAIKAKGKQVPFRVEGDARRTAHCGRRKEVKSDDSG